MTQMTDTSTQVPSATDTRTLLEALADFALSISPETTPRRVREQGGLTVLDTLGCMLAGATSPEASAFARAERRTSGSPLPSTARARVLAFAGDAFELNDLVGGHASIGTVSASLVVARDLASTGTELLDAVIGGDEITSRIFESQAWQQKGFDESGIVVTSMMSSIGTAAAVARLHGVTAGTMAHAMAIAGALAPWGPAEVIFGDGGTSKPVQFGAGPADAAIRAIEYAREGLTGPLRLIESPLGLMTAVANGYDAAAIRGDGRWYLLETQRKLHAACGFTHSSIDAVRALVGQGVDVASADSIELQVPDYIMPAVSKSVPPTTPNDARFHLQYMAAVAANGADVILPKHSIRFAEYLADPAVAATMRRITVTPLDETALAPGQRYNRSRALVRTADGAVVEYRNPEPRGAFERPLTDDEVIGKFRSLASPLLSAAQLDAVIDTALHLDETDSLDALHVAVDRVLDVL